MSIAHDVVVFLSYFTGFVAAVAIMVMTGLRHKIM